MIKKLSILIGVFALLFMTGVVSAQEAATRSERAEIRFLEGMIDHHQMALDMASDCLAKAVTESVQTLCQNVITAQSREILTMRGWLLAWYMVDYEPVSMLHADHEDASASEGMMQGGMMMGMSDMMAQMSGMMEMMGGMMQDGGMGMGMMDGGMGMMGGGDTQMGAMPDMPVERGMHMFSMMGMMTVSDLLEATADLDPATPLMDALGGMMESGAMGMGSAMPMMGEMTFGQMMAMMTEMGNLTIGDVQEMMGHLDDGANATMMAMMQHHMEVMAGGDAAAGDGDHEAHHPESTEAAPAAQSEDHSDHETVGGATGDHADHEASGELTDPSMMMGMMAGLSRLTGTDYEIAWLEAMIDHHDDAIHMSERLLPQVVHTELGELAQQIIDDQSAEIEAMETLIIDLANAQ